MLDFRTRARGFTLIELLVVIAIIGILSSVVLASLNTARQKARDAKRIAEIGEIAKALDIYYVSANSYLPTTPSGYLAPDAALKSLVASGLLSRVPIVIEPSAGGYMYIGSKENGTPATECAVTADLPCNGYILAIVLERNDSPVLANDPNITLGGFDGGSADCVGGAGADFCYAKVK